jgi:hypothetical protein
MICEKCKQNPGEPYSFFYGNKIGERSYQQGNKKITKTTYKIGGRAQAYLCKKCARRNFKDWILLTALAILFFGQVIFVVYSIISPALDGGLFAFCLIIPILFSLMFFITEISKSKLDIAENKAIEIKRRELELQGFDSFWNTKAYKNLNIETFPDHHFKG